ncbi:MAG: hypothetical protein XXXJIFNMEKO3_02557 [Candidatus Erwinia impunctatus]|nr:hypothetical protein XXXJIFNMEKO_02557 [Culicoides impunctatus]
MNRKNFTHILTSFILLAASAAPFAHSASGGTIHFTGSIVEGGCTVNNTQTTVNVGCAKGGGKTITTKIPFNAKEAEFPGGKISGVNG